MTRHAWHCIICIATALCLACGAFAQSPAPAGEVFVQTGNSLQITAARFSPDGQWIASCDGLGAVVAWDASSGRQFRAVHRHTGLCMGVAFTPDGQGLLSSGGPRSGGEVVLTRWTDATVLQTWLGHKGQVRDLVATLDSAGAWSLGDTDGLLRWAVGTATPVQRISCLMDGEDPKDAPGNVAMALTADQKLAYVGRTDGSVMVIDLTGSTAARRLAKLPEAISALALSPDARLLAVTRGNIMGSGDKDVLLLDSSSGEEVRRLKGHAGNVFALAFSPDGQLLASAAQIDTMAMLNIGVSAIKEHESLRLWRVNDGSPLADLRNQRNVNGTPFLHGGLSFSKPGAGTDGSLRLVLALWDEAARMYELDAAYKLRLVHTLEGRGLSPRQLQASDASARLLVTDGRPRIAPKDVFMDAATVRREFGRDADWTEERMKRLQTVYGGRGWLTQSQRAALWDLKTGRLEQVLDWQRAPVSDLGLDAQGRFVSVAPLFPQTTMVSPLKTRIVREARADAQGELSYSHFGYEPWDGPPDELFIPLPGASLASAVTPTRAPHEGGYSSEVTVQSPTQRWTVVGGIPIESTKDKATSKMSPRLFVQERLEDGSRLHRHDIAAPGLVRAMAISADERTLWAAGTSKGVIYNNDHEAWLMAIDLVSGQVTRQWKMAVGVTVDRLVAHPSGNMALTNGTVALNVWDKNQEARKYRVESGSGQDGGRNLRAMAMTADARSIVTSDLAGWTVLWDWPQDGPPAPKWSRQLASPAPHLLGFMNKDQRIAAGANDGSVRILGAGNGDEIARMIRFDNGEWITMIPEGYFVASQEGDRWVNVRMGNRVYGVDQFYDVFYRPDIVERKLSGLPIAPLITVTLEDALRRPPPQVSLRLPAGTAAGTAGQKVSLDLQLQTQGGGVGEVRILHNGKLIQVLNKAAPLTSPPASAPSALASAAQGTVRAEQAVTRALRLAVVSQQEQAAAAAPMQAFSAQVELELVAGENAITAIGFNGAGNLNARPLTRVVQAGGTAPPPRVFVLAVGINKFSNPNVAPDLSTAVKDSSDFAEALRARMGTTYAAAPVIVRTLNDQAATRAGLNAALEQLQKEMRPSDFLIWFVASHGTLDNNAQYGIVLQDWDGRDRESSLFSTRDILGAAQRIRAFNQLVILDTCHAGGVSSLVRGLYDARLAVLARNMGLHVFASASATEEAWDSYQGNGLFTHTLLKGLRGGAADRNGDHKVSITELGDYARRETLQIARRIGHNQEPLLMSFGKDVTVYATD